MRHILLRKVARDRVLRALVLFTLAALSPACGGGGGGGKGGGGTVSYDLSGAFSRVSFSGGGTTNISRVETSSFASGGTYTESGTANSAGTISAVSDSGTFAVSSGALSWNDTSGASFSGGVLAGGGFAISSCVTSGILPTVVVDLKNGGGTFMNATVSGTYFVAGYAYVPGGPYNACFTGTLTADGSGNWSLSATNNVNGTIVFGAANSGTYSIAADGSASWTDLSGQIALGGVLAGGNLIITSVASAGNGPQILVGVRQGGAFNNGSMQGGYHEISFGSTPGVAASHFSLSTSAQFSGTGNLTWTATQNLEGTISAIPTVSETYSIASDGTLTINDPGGLTFSGGVLAGGSVAVAACITSGGYMELRIYVHD